MSTSTVPSPTVPADRVADPAAAPPQSAPPSAQTEPVPVIPVSASPHTEDRPLRRDMVAAVIFAIGVLLLILGHLADLVHTLTGF